MYCINTIQALNNSVTAKLDAEATTHWVELPTGGVVISVRDQKGDIQKAQLDEAKGEKFLKALGNHDGIKPVWQHRQAVCRKFVK
jgi:hypothetical protein